MGYDLDTAMTDLANNNMFVRLFGLDKRQEVIDELVQKWKSQPRFYHSINNHLLPMLDTIRARINYDSSRTKLMLEIIAWFHDCIYNPKSIDNEDNCIEFFDKVAVNKDDLEPETSDIREVIHMTKDFKNVDNDIKSYFANLDLAYLKGADAIKIYQNELLMLKEFQFVDYSLYKKRRIEILKGLRGNECIDWVNASRIDSICRYLENHRPRIGLYPGSFNPFHVGHLSILKETEKLFDKVIVAIGINPEKKSTDVSTSLSKVKEILPYHQVEYFASFLHEYVEKKSKDADITVIRGFRSGYDIDYELTNLAFMRDMSDNVKTVFIAPQKKFDHVSSSAIRLLKGFSKGETERYIPETHYPAP